MHVITEDTPPDMLAGAMDLFIYLPTGNRIKMSVERSTPMMDLLVQICTNNNLQLSKHTLQAIEIAPSSEYNDRALPYKPNTPIGVLDTQTIKVIPKTKSVAPVPKNIPPGHQPFESTFRLKVHLPRNQLYVIRVSQHIHLSEVMRKVCDEKNLDVLKYEFRHPGNFDETLNPNLTISDYKITEVYMVTKGTMNMNQFFSPTDIMTLRKEEERKQMHNKTGGGVFNLIFRKVKGSTGSTLPPNEHQAVPQSNNKVEQIVNNQEVDKPKPPPRKRRPAPKPPQESVNRKLSTDSKDSTESKPESGLTICHSRNSSDSSGYHEASILSDHGNSSLPRRPGTDIVTEPTNREHLTGKFSQSTSNLTKMSAHSKSTSSLFLGRKKKAAPAPPPPQPFKKEPSPPTSPSPVETSQSTLGKPPVPKPRNLAASEDKSNTYTRKTMFDSYTRKRGFQIGLSLLQNGDEDTKSVTSMGSECNSVDSALNKFNFVDEYNDEYESVNVELFHNQGTKNSEQPKETLQQLHGMHFYESNEGELLPHLSRGNLSKSLDNLDEIGDGDPGDAEVIENSHLYKDSMVKAKSVSKTEIRSPSPETSTFDGGADSCQENIYETIPEKKSLPAPQISTVAIANEPEPEPENDTARYSFNEDIYTSVKKIPKDRNIEEEVVQNETKFLERNAPSEGEWTYRLPSPPLGFKDVTHEPDLNESTVTQTDFKDSIVTSPELFEKIVRKDDHFDRETVLSDASTSTILEERGPSMSNLSLESLEKRQSLVYNRELSTSFRSPDIQENFNPNDVTFSIKKPEQTSNPSKVARVVPDRETELLKQQNQKLYEEIKMIKESKKLNQEAPPALPERETRHTNTLPNFKISSYSGEKKKIVNIFEDESVRSNRTDSLNKNPAPQQEYTFYKPKETSNPSSEPTSNINRTKSFSTDKLSKWTPSKPVARSKSQTALNGRPELDQNSATEVDDLSGSLTDISGLQSLGVLRVIQNKLSTPTSSCEALNGPDKTRRESFALESSNKTVPEEKPAVFSNSNNNYNRFTTPSINMSTWSERPKVPVVLKHDVDYKLKRQHESTAKTNFPINSPETVSNNSRVNIIKVNEFAQTSKSSNPSKDTDFSNIRRNSGNVTITIGGGNNFVNCTTAAGYRKPFSNINKIDRPQRPHSIAFDSDFDISRVPVVRSVEFKKPFRNNTSITQINVENKGSAPPNAYNRGALSPKFPAAKTALSYANSFGKSNAPIVRGFKTVEIEDASNQSGGHQSLPFLHNLNKHANLNSSNNSNRISLPVKEKSAVSNAPPPPLMPALRPVPINKQAQVVNAQSGDPRDELLSAIRNFGGKKGLRAVKMC